MTLKSNFPVLPIAIILMFFDHLKRLKLLLAQDIIQKQMLDVLCVLTSVQSDPCSILLVQFNLIMNTFKLLGPTVLSSIY